MNRKLKEIVAVICSLALVICSITVYNTTTVEASQSKTGNGKKYTVTDGSNVGWTGFTCNGLEIFNKYDGFIHFAWGIDVNKDTIKVKIDDSSVRIYNEGTKDFYIAYSEFKDLANGEYTIEVTAKKDDETDVSGNATLKIEEETSPTTVPGKVMGLELHIDDAKTNYTVAFQGVEGATSYKVYIDGNYFKDIVEPGALVTFVDAKLEEGKTYNFQVSAVNSVGEGERSDVKSVTVPKKEPTTDNPADVTIPYKYLEYRQIGTSKYYVAAGNNEFPFDKLIAHDDKIEIVTKVNSGTKPIWPDFKDPTINGGTEGVSIEGAGINIKYSVLNDNAYNVFEATSAAQVHRFQIIIKVGNPEGGEAAEEYTVTVDGTPTQVEENAEFTLPTTSTYGYICGDEAYKSGSKVTITKDMVFTSIGIPTIEVAGGASINYSSSESSGLRFKTTVTSSDAVLNSKAVATGMLITPNDYYMGNGMPAFDNTNCEFINVVNEGWYGRKVGEYCSSIVNIKHNNWTRDFIARAYVKITYAEGEPTYIYSAGMTGDRSVQEVATAIVNAGYPNLSEEAKGIIDIFATVSK